MSAGAGGASPLRDWCQRELAGLEARGLLRELEPMAGRPGGRVWVRGRELLNFSSNDYLGLAGDPRLAEAARAALEAGGTGSTASRLIAGDREVFHRLEARLAAFEGAEAAVLFSSGYAANVGALQALFGPEDVLFSDALNHASIIDGCRLSRAQVVVYPHCDTAALSALLSRHPGRRRAVVTDAIFSMDGDVAPLVELSALARSHGAALIVDEAHATGVLGPRGAGLTTALGLESAVDLRIGTLSKALGVAGAYAAGPREAARFLLCRARSLVYSTMSPPALAAAALAAIDIVEREEERRAVLWRRTAQFAAGLGALRFPAAVRSPIFPVVLGAPERALAAAAFLRERGIWARAIRPPTVPEGTSRLRFALSAAHGEEDVARALEALAAWRRSDGGR